jgi:hypothetical protein
VISSFQLALDYLPFTLLILSLFLVVLISFGFFLSQPFLALRWHVSGFMIWMVIWVAIGVTWGCACWTGYWACFVDGDGWQMGCDVGLNTADGGG